MIGVCLYWDNDFVKGIGAKRYYSYTKQTAKAFGATHLFWIGIEKESLVNDREIITEVFDSVNEVMKAYKKKRFVFVDPDGAYTLKTLPPVDDVIFFFGPDGDKLPVPKKEYSLKINSNIELYAHVAMGIVLHGLNNNQ